MPSGVTVKQSELRPAAKKITNSSFFQEPADRWSDGLCCCMPQKSAKVLTREQATLTNDRDNIMDAVSSHGMALSLADTKWRHEKDIVLLAVKNDPEALQVRPCSHARVSLALF